MRRRSNHLDCWQPPADRNPNDLSTVALELHAWLRTLAENGWKIFIPEIADYEVRRELIRAKKIKSVAELNELKMSYSYVPITTEHMLLAANLWAQARNAGQPTSDPKALDGDVILSAQALTIASHFDTVIVATTNVAHISRYCQADHWRNIAP